MMSGSILDKKEVAALLGVSPRTIDKWVAQRKIPYLQITQRTIRFEEQAVRESLNRHCLVKEVQ